MHRITLPAQRLVFPDRCLRCGATPGSAFMMELGEQKTEVPLCEVAAFMIRRERGR